MNNAQKISKLVERFGESAQVFEKKQVLGFIPITLRRGWLWIADAGDHWSVMLANGKTTHLLLGGPILGADFRKDNGERKRGSLGLTGAWKSAISMWPIRNEEEAVRIFNFISSRVDLAFCFHSETSA